MIIQAKSFAYRRRDVLAWVRHLGQHHRPPRHTFFWLHPNGHRERLPVPRIARRFTSRVELVPDRERVIRALEIILFRGGE
jgi:hypothetical protein